MILCVCVNFGVVVKCACVVKYIAYSAYASSSFFAFVFAYVKYLNEYLMMCNLYDEYFDGLFLGV